MLDETKAKQDSDRNSTETHGRNLLDYPSLMIRTRLPALEVEQTVWESIMPTPIVEEVGDLDKEGSHG